MEDNVCISSTFNVLRDYIVSLISFCVFWFFLFCFSSAFASLNNYILYNLYIKVIV